MAITPGLTGNNQTAGTAEEQFFVAPSGTGRCSKLRVRCRSDTGASLLVRIPELHGASTWATLVAGEVADFRVNNGELMSAFCKGNGAKLDWYVLEVTKGP